MILLTDEEIKLLGEGTSGTWQDDLQFARAIEASVIKKLSEQEPVAWWNGKETAFFEHETDGPIGEVSIPLYLHPKPQSEWQPIEAKGEDK